MTIETTAPAAPASGRRRTWRSVGAVAAGFLAVVILSLGTDQLLHALEVYPPWGQPMDDPGLNALALAYRCVYSVLGSWLAARLAPRAPMRHAIALGVVGLVPAVAGAVVAITAANLGPSWYPIAIVLATLPCAWLGGVLHRATRGGGRAGRGAAGV